MGLTDSYAYFLPVHALYQIVSIKLCHNCKITGVEGGDASGSERFALRPTRKTTAKAN